MHTHAIAMLLLQADMVITYKSEKSIQTLHEAGHMFCGDGLPLACCARTPRSHDVRDLAPQE